MLPESPPDGTVSVDRLLGGRVVLLQPRRGYRVAVDPMLLAAAVPVGHLDVLDAGCGTGAAALCLATRSADCRIVALERDPGHAALARESVRRNGLGERITVVAGDLLAPPEPLRRQGFDAVITNPPFNAPRGNAPHHAGRAAAHVEEVAPAVWLQACLRRLRPRGLLVLIHRADRLDAVLAALHGPAGAITVLPVWPRAGTAARRVVVLARKGARGPATLAPGLVLHDAGGGFTDRAEAILRHAAPLEP